MTADPMRGAVQRDCIDIIRVTSMSDKWRAFTVIDETEVDWAKLLLVGQPDINPACSKR
jgi:hypothetical protein